MPRILDAEFVLLQDNIVNEICCISALQDREDLQIRWMEIIQQFILPVELNPGTSLGIQPLIFVTSFKHMRPARSFRLETSRYRTLLDQTLYKSCRIPAGSKSRRRFGEDDVYVVISTRQRIGPLPQNGIKYLVDPHGNESIAVLK